MYDVRCTMYASLLSEELSKTGVAYIVHLNSVSSGIVDYP